MKTHNDYVDTFGPERTPEDVITRLNELAEEGHYVFRGYGKQSELLPGIMREKAYIPFLFRGLHFCSNIK